MYRKWKVCEDMADFTGTESDISSALGYPNGHGTERWADCEKVENPEHTDFDKCIIPIPESLEGNYAGLVDYDSTWIVEE